MSDQWSARWRSRVRRAAASVGIAAAFFLSTSTTLAAQTCPCPTFDLATSVQQADTIFVGRALSATNDSSGAMRNNDGGWVGNNDTVTRLLFDVQTTIKGAPPRFIDVLTPAVVCGGIFAVGETYLVVGKEAGAAVITDACKGNVSGAGAIDTRVQEIRTILNPPPMPRGTRERR